MADDPWVKHGGPAFPLSLEGTGKAYKGMTLRDYFAAKAMHAEALSAGSFEGPAIALVEAAVKAGQTVEQRMAFNAYKLADAMLAERAK